MGIGPIAIFVVVATPMLAFLGWIVWRRWSVVIPPRQAGLVIRRGKPTDTTLPAGVHFTPPWNQTVEVYPDYELTYMTLPLERLGTEGSSDADYTDPPFGVIDREKVSSDVYYTLRFTIVRDQLKRIHERFGATGIKGIIRDESRRVIQATFAEDDYRLADLAGPSRAALEQVLTERLTERLAASGFALVFLSLQEPDLRELGRSLQEQVKAREELVLEQLRLQIGEAKARRLLAEAQVEASIEAERVRLRAAAEAAATITRARAEAAAGEERALRSASISAQVEELKAIKRRELASIEAEVRLKRAESIAQSSGVLTGDLMEFLVRLEVVERWREVMERWDGQIAVPIAAPTGSVLPPSPEALWQVSHGSSPTGAEAANRSAAARPAEVDRHGD
jgi:regulator of protease activity HflC (stomatin/prohibitin superfamily)